MPAAARKWFMDNTTQQAYRDATSGWEDEGGAERSPHGQPESERRDKRRDDAAPRPLNDEVPANRREDPRNEDHQDLERKDRRST